MKPTRIFISTLTFALIAGAAPAAKLCQLDWLAAWKNKSGTLSNSTYAAVSSYGSSAEIGTWSVTSDEGSSGVKHTVSGMSQCTDDTGTTSTNNVMWPSSTLASNVNCWCRMTSPNLGGSWVFVYTSSSAAPCAYSCANNCAYCVLLGTYGSCARSAVLALP
ncbi:MAG: hypothetical protein LBT45_02770 [Rickettsiales bacterium]|nr:hypothetical protein [Rickettsiales bacterium]